MNDKNLNLAIKVANNRPKYRSSILHFLARKGFLSRVAGDKKRMVIMVGPPASGKGYFLEGETGQSGKNLPKSTKGLFTEDQIPEEKVGVEESDNHLRFIQYSESQDHYEKLNKAHKKGEKEFKKVLDDMWYKTKDGDNRKLSSFVSFDEFPDKHYDFFSNESKAFYKNMRSWHNDVDDINPKTGKIKERFKDDARERFEENVKKKLGEGDKNMLIVDSAGEDIDAQDFGGQIEAAKTNGYEVTVIMLEPEMADTNLSNMSRGFVSGKRMVDQQDIDNFYEKYEKQLEAVKKAAPHNFLQYKKPPLSPEKRKKLKKLMEEAPDGTPTFLKDPDSKIRTVDDLPGGVTKKDKEAYAKAVEKWKKGGKKGKEPDEPKRTGQAKAVSKNVGKTLYSEEYTLDKSSSFGVTMKGVPNNPHFEEDKSKAKNDNKEKDPSSSDKKWLEQKVKNPETGNDVKIKTLKSKPKDSDGHKLYEKLRKDRKKKTAAKIAKRSVLSKRIASRYSSEKHREAQKMAGKMQRDMKELGKKVLKKNEEIDGYEVEMEVGRGPLIYFTLLEASGNATAARKARESLDKEIKEGIKDMVGGNLKHQIKSYNKGDDLIVVVELIFPTL